MTKEQQYRKIAGIPDDPSAPGYVPYRNGTSNPNAPTSSGFSMDGTTMTSNGGDYSNSSSHSTGNPIEDFSIAVSGQGNAADLKSAGDRARNDLIALSNMAWARQMQGLQRALGSMNNYNGVLSNLYGVPTNYYDPSLSGGIMGSPAGPPGQSTPSAPYVRPGFVPATRTDNGYRRPGFVATGAIPPSDGPAIQDPNGRGAF